MLLCSYKRQYAKVYILVCRGSGSQSNSELTSVAGPTSFRFDYRIDDVLTKQDIHTQRETES